MLINNVRVQKVAYGGTLSGPNQEYRFNVAGQIFQIDSTHYIQIEKPDGTIMCVSTDHSGAYPLAVKFYQEGKISGDEKFAHIDQGNHHDSFDLTGRIPPLTADLSEHIRACESKQIDQCNYVTALDRQFEQMHFVFLRTRYTPRTPMIDMYRHEDEHLFSYNGELGGHGHSYRLNQNSIASVDLDIFELYRGDLNQVLVDCPMIWLFTSPGYIPVEKAEYHGNDLIAYFLNRKESF